jgi:hypothetical protein
MQRFNEISDIKLNSSDELSINIYSLQLILSHRTICCHSVYIAYEENMIISCYLLCIKNSGKVKLNWNNIHAKIIICDLQILTHEIYNEVFKLYVYMYIVILIKWFQLESKYIWI